MADEKKLKHFCHIERFENWLQGLSDKQKSLVIDMGAGFVFSLKSKMRLDDCLTKYLVHIFDWKKEALEVEEGNFLYIKSLIKDLYDLPNTGDKVPSRTRKTAISGDLKTKFSWLFNCRVGKLWEQAKAATSDDEFSVLFMLALLNMFLAPSGSVVDVSFLDDLIDHQKIKGFDWCTFIADCLVTGIYKYKEGELPHVCGCLHILHLIYADYVKCTDTKAPPAGVPRSAHITDADLEYAAKKAASVSLKKKSSSSTDVESMDSSPQNCRLNYRKPKAPASGLGTAVDLINIRQSALFKGVSDLEEYYGGSSYETGTEISGPVETSGGNGSLRTTGEDLFMHEEVHESNHASNMEEEEEEVDLGDVGNNSHHADVEDETQEARDRTSCVKVGSKYLAIASTARRRSPRPGIYIAKQYRLADRRIFNESYEKHVLFEKSSCDPKVSIGDASVTAEQFINSLKEGEVTTEFVNVSIRALINDWKFQDKYTGLIIDPPALAMILDENCTQKFVDDYLRNEARMNLLERIYFMLNNKSHWFLSIMLLEHKKLLLFCPTLDASERKKEHQVVAKNVADKLQASLLRLMESEPLRFPFDGKTVFDMVFPDESEVDVENAYVYLLHIMEEHKGDEINECRLKRDVGSTQIRRLAHILVDHELNIFNPKRDEQDLGKNITRGEMLGKRRRKLGV